MATVNQSSSRWKSIVILTLVLLVSIGVIALAVDRSNTSERPSSTETQQSKDTTDVSALISFTLPAGWTQTDCGGGNLIYAMPGSSEQSCTMTTNPDRLVTLSVKDQITDCQQLQNVQNVRKHICSSVFIDGHKTIKSTTEYPENANEAAKTISNYYVDTGNTVVRAQYVRHQDNSWQQGFDELAKSIKVKG